MRRWYAVQTHAHSETKAAFNLTRQGFDVYLPCYLKVRRHARRTEATKAVLFPRYLFIEFDADSDGWGVIRSTFGVQSLVCNGREPIPVPNWMIGDIRAREDANGMVQIGRTANFRAGEPVRILTGAFAEQIGIFDTDTGEDRVRVLLALLGRTVSLDLPISSIAVSA
jgi:transcriptional antiterminator RfaH